MSANLNFIQRQNKPLNQTEEKTLNQKLSQIEKNALEEKIYEQISLNIKILQMLQTKKISEKVNNFFNCDVSINNNLCANTESKDATQNNDISIALLPNFPKVKDGLTNDKKTIPMIASIINMTDDLYKKLIEKLKLDPSQNRTENYIALSKHLKLNNAIDQEIINTLNNQYNEIDSQITLDEETMRLLSRKYKTPSNEIQSLLATPLHYKLTFILGESEELQQKQRSSSI